MQGVMSLIIMALLLVASLATMAMVLNVTFAFAATGFKNKSECMEYVIEDSYVVRNHALKSAKVSKELAEKLCAEYWFKSGHQNWLRTNKPSMVQKEEQEIQSRIYTIYFSRYVINWLMFFV